MNTSVNPARAGMIRRPWPPSAQPAGKPRASGDDPVPQKPATIKAK